MIQWQSSMISFIIMNVLTSIGRLKNLGKTTCWFLENITLTTPSITYKLYTSNMMCTAEKNQSTKSITQVKMIASNC